MEAIWWQIFDILGTLAFSVSGILVAVSRRMDLFGIFVLAAVTAVGGGIIRDTMLGNTPPIALQSGLYFFLIVGAIVATTIILRYFDMDLRLQIMHRSLYLYLAGDTIGLASFTITGTLSGIYYAPNLWVLCITLGVITAVGGGIIRDVLAGKVPTVLIHEVYATASILGSFTLYILYTFEWPLEIASLVSFAVTVSCRFVAIKAKLDVPHIKRKRHDQFL